MTQHHTFKTFAIVISLICTITLLSVKSYAQESKPKRIEFKNSIDFNLMGLISREVLFGYERNLNERNIIRLGGGIKFSGSSDSFRSKQFLLFSTSNDNKVTKGYTFSVAYKYIISTYARLYLSTELYYKHLYYNNIYYQECVGTDNDSYISLQSLSENRKGFNIMFGKKLRVKSGKKIGLEFDFFFSTGLYFKDSDITIHAKRKGTCSIGAELYEYDPPKVEHTGSWVPYMSYGVLISMPFRRVDERSEE